MHSPPIDYHTLFLSAGIVAATFLALHAIQERKPYPGFGRTVIGTDLLTAAIVAGDLRGFVSDALWIIQVTAIFAFALIDSGLRLFCEAPRRGRWPIVYVGAAILLLTCLFFFQPLYVRILFTSLLLIPIFVDASLPLLGAPPNGRSLGYRFTAAAFLLGCIAACVRIVAMLHLQRHASPYFAAHPVNTLFFFLVMFLLLTLSFGLLTLTHERLVAELKATHEQLKSTHERLLLALEASSSGAFEWIIKNGLNIWGAELEKLYGFEPGTFPGTRSAWLECVLPEDVAQVDEANREALETGYFGTEWRIKRKNDGQIRWVLSHARVEFDQEGKADRMIGINVDITERKWAEEKIRLSEQRYRSLVRTSSQLVWTCDPYGYFGHEIEDWQRFTGQTADQVHGFGWLNAIHPEDRDKALKAWRQATETRSAYAVECRLRRYDGNYRIMQERAAPVFDNAGQVFEWIGMSTDVTEQRFAEERLRRNEKLAVAGRLALSISHEINNPLAAATNLVYLIGSDPGLSEATRKFAADAERELSRVSQAVRSNLRFAIASSRPDDVDLRELADSVTELFRTQFETDHISIERDYRTEARLRCHPQELQVAIANLLSNAHDAMRKGGKLIIRIREAHSWNDSGIRGLKLTIADSGTGIPRDLRPKIFEPFFTTKEETGAGLGLWVCSEIVRKHEGRIMLWTSTAQSHPGTVFSLFFPFQRSPASNLEITRTAA